MIELTEPTAAAFTADVEPNAIRLATKEKGVVGTLYLDEPIRFEGDADESARAFFECLIARTEIRKES